MAKENTTLKDLIKEIDFRLTHLEDMEYDNRKLMIKLVKQSNQVVEFLKSLQIQMEDVTEDYKYPTLDHEEKYSSVRDLVEEFMDKAEELKELEKELSKYKDQITPGQVGES